MSEIAPPSGTPLRGAVSRPRWWPALGIVVLAFLALGWIWIGQAWLGLEAALMRQNQVMSTILVAVIAAPLLVLWALLFSRFSRKRRVGIAVTLVVAGGAVAGLVRIRGVSGDLVPILALRWTSEVDTPVVVETGAVGDAVETETVVPTIAVGEISATDFPQFLGPDRNAVLHGVRLARDWTASPPRLVWKRPIGAGWSSFAIVGSHAITQEQRGEAELVVCYELASGRIAWSHADVARYDSVVAGVGPRATPTVTADRVYALGATGRLNCLERATGRPRWMRQVVEENGAENPVWGKSCSPLVCEGQVIVSAGGRDDRSLVAYDAETGEPVWAAGHDRSGYGSPALVTLAGRRQVLILNKASLAAHDPRTGAMLWEHPWPGKHPSAAQPVPIDAEHVFVSSGYGVGCKLFAIETGPGGEFSARMVWERRTLKAKFANFVLADGCVYGLDDGILACVDTASGKRRWKGGRYGHGQLLLVEDVLLVTTDTGEVVLVDPVPDAHRELTRFRALDGRTWASPALSGSTLIVRSDREVACYDLPRAN